MQSRISNYFIKTILPSFQNKLFNYKPWIFFAFFSSIKLVFLSLVISFFLSLTLPSFFSMSLKNVFFTILNLFSIKMIVLLIVLSIGFEFFSNKDYITKFYNINTLTNTLTNKFNIESIYTKIVFFLTSDIDLKEKTNFSTIYNALLSEIKALSIKIQDENNTKNFSQLVSRVLRLSLSIFIILCYKSIDFSNLSNSSIKNYFYSLKKDFLFVEYFLVSIFLIGSIFNFFIGFNFDVSFISIFFNFNITTYFIYILFLAVLFNFLNTFQNTPKNFSELQINNLMLSVNLSWFKNSAHSFNLASVIYFVLPLLQIFVIFYKCFKQLNDPVLSNLTLSNLNQSSYLIIIDWLSWPFVLLTVIIIYLTLFLFYHKPKSLQVENKWTNSLNIINLNVLLLFLFLAFTTNDILFFYFMFESTLIPMFFLLGFFGSRTRKIRAAYSFFLYTMLGSVALLFGIFQLIITYKTTQINVLINYNNYLNVPNYVWWCLFWGFGVKVPIVPFHNWLAEAHVEAPTIGSVILAALLLKLGGYGIIRILFLVLPNLSILNAPYAIAINTLSFFYASFMALRQFDFKRIIAYSSIAHMNFALIGVFSFNIEAVQGSIFLMIAHGLVSAGLFIGVGLLYELIGTRLIITFGGLKRVWPVTSFLFLLFILANFGFPLTPNFVGELLIIIGGVHQILTVMTLITFGTILTLVYSLVLYSKMFLGSLKPTVVNWSTYLLKLNFDKNIFYTKTILVLNYNIVLRALLVLCIITGLYPTVILQLTNDYVAWFLLQKYYFA